jgi:hypothetical protein
MRFVFPSDAEHEASERERLVLAMQSAWNEIEKLVRSASPDESALGRVARTVDARIRTELLTERDGSRTIVVTPREERGLRPLIDTFVNCAPKLDGVRVTAHRPQRALAEALETVKREHGFDLETARARIGFSRGHLLELVLYGKGFGGRSDDNAACAAERLVESLVGERVLDDWVGQIDAEPLTGTGRLRVIAPDETPTVPLAELAGTVASATESLRSGLPEIPRAPLRDGWTLFETHPEAATDYAAQDDIVLASSALPEMLKCFLEGAPFSSLRFTPRDEVFAYVKLDGEDKSLETRLAERVELEDLLANELGGSATLVGNGLGLRYAYIDLALTPDATALGRVCELLRRGGVSRRSWISFCDTDWSEEWIGVWPDSPAPFSALE